MKRATAALSVHDFSLPTWRRISQEAKPCTLLSKEKPVVSLPQTDHHGNLILFFFFSLKLFPQVSSENECPLPTTGKSLHTSPHFLASLNWLRYSKKLSSAVPMLALAGVDAGLGSDLTKAGDFLRGRKGNNCPSGAPAWYTKLVIQPAKGLEKHSKRL